MISLHSSLFTSIARVALLAAPLSAMATVTVVEGFAAAQKKSTEAKQPLVVLVHGSAWQRASRTLHDSIWTKEEFHKRIQGDVILSNVGILQNPSEEESKAFKEKNKGWNRDTLRTFPAIQVYAPDGHLLRSLSGRELAAVATHRDLLADTIHPWIQASAQRDQLLAKINSKDADPASIAQNIDALNRLPIRSEDKAIEKFRKLDPSDSSGWVARLSFGGWRFVRNIHDRIQKKETDEALSEVEKMLENKIYAADQRALLLGAKGMLLAAKGDKERAWATYQEAHQADPNGPNGKAMLMHGYRTIGKNIPGVKKPEPDQQAGVAAPPP